jgi:hypothetical protein
LQATKKAPKGLFIDNLAEAVSAIKLFQEIPSNTEKPLFIRLAGL